MRRFHKECSEKKVFDQRFERSTKEILVLTENNTSAGRSGQNQLWTAYVSIIAFIDLQTGELVKNKGILEWLMTDKECKSNKKIYNLKKETIYRLRVRESKPFIHTYNSRKMERGRWLMVVDVLERNCYDERLEAILKDYQKEIVIHPQGCGELLLNKSLRMFSGEGKWNNEDCIVNLDADENKQTADNALKTLNILLQNQDTFDKQARKCAANRLTNLANDWAEDEYEISKEEFIRRISISELCVSLDGYFDIYYNDDDMFLGHVIIVNGHIEKGFDDASIAG